MQPVKKVGLLFGSFNPIHTGHMIVANVMVETTDLDRVWFVVTPQNPHKSSRSLLHDFDRYDMVEAAVADNYKLEVTDIEFHLPKPNYSILTLVHLKEKHPEKEFVLILGEDNLVNFTKWKNYQAILENFQVYVYPRPNVGESSLKNHPSVKIVPAPLLDISATFIRECIQKGFSIRYLVPDIVESMIRSRKFYL